MASRPQPHRLTWPLTPSQMESIDQMFEMLFRRTNPVTLLNAFTYASLPTAVEGMCLIITDSNTAVWGATITGGGANRVFAYFNGAHWTVAGI